KYCPKVPGRVHAPQRALAFRPCSRGWRFPPPNKSSTRTLMTGSITFFPVSNGDMVLLRLDNDQRVLIDINIRGKADDENDDTPNVAEDLRSRLERDDQGRLYVDAFLLSHPHTDHITGLQNHFHLGPPDTWDEDDDKILIREMWSSPVVFRRAGANGETL